MGFLTVDLRLKGANSVVAFEILPEPPSQRSKDNPWPQFPRVFKVDYGHDEVKAKTGKDPRHYSILSKVSVGRILSAQVARI